MMTRREALLRLTALTGGTFFGATRFLRGAPDASATAGGGVPFQLSSADRVLLNEIGETILPSTDDSAGAKAADVAVFMEEIVRDFYDERERGVFTDGLAQVRTAARARFGGRDFLQLTPAERFDFVLALDRATPRLEYYRMIKQLTEWGYFTSEIGATQALAYLPVPGAYHGCVPLEPGARAASY